MKVSGLIAGRAVQQFALFLNVLGALFIFVAFQANSSDFSLITSLDPPTQTHNIYTICVENKYPVLRSDPSTSGTMLGPAYNNCPVDGKRVAVVNSEHPALGTMGLLLIFFGLIIQLFGVPKDATPEALREAQKAIREAHKLISDVKKERLLREKAL
jgi:hypothetical protein